MNRYKYRISFCTTCCNRLYQFEKTFDHNYSFLISHPNTEWVFLNYNSTDGLDQFIQEKLPNLSHRFLYLKENSGASWHASIAKNIAHKHASGEILLNLDCDNFLGSDIHHLSTSRHSAYHFWSGQYLDGTFGRIAVSERVFRALGGYDESFYPMAVQDRDLLERIEASGNSILKVQLEDIKAIKNEKEDSIKWCASSGLSWEDFRIRNLKKSTQNIKNKKYIANDGIIAREAILSTSNGGDASI